MARARRPAKAKARRRERPQKRPFAEMRRCLEVSFLTATLQPVIPANHTFRSDTRFLPLQSMKHDMGACGVQVSRDAPTQRTARSCKTGSPRMTANMTANHISPAFTTQTGQYSPARLSVPRARLPPATHGQNILTRRPPRVQERMNHPACWKSAKLASACKGSPDWGHTNSTGLLVQAQKWPHRPALAVGLGWRLPE